LGLKAEMCRYLNVILTVQEDVGIYTCTASNTEGKIHAVLEVAGKDSLSMYFSKYSRFFAASW
jgi:hypothetical protein